MKRLKLEKLERTTVFVILVGIFVLLNFLIAFAPLRLDLSSGKAYTLSPSTGKILKDLDDVVNITLYISSDLPIRILPLKTDVIDLANEFGRYGKVKVEVKDPKKDSNAKEEAESLGIQQLQLSEIDRNKRALTSGYFAIAILYEDEREIIPQATNLESLEYDIASAIFKMTRKEPIKIGLLGTERTLDVRSDDLSTVKRVFTQQFDIDYVDISTASANIEVDPSFKTILVFDNSQEYVKAQKDALKKYIEGGGAVVFMVDGVRVKEGLLTENATHGLFDLFESYGVTLEPDFVLSSSSEMASFTTGTVSFFTPYPFWIRTANFAEKAGGEFSSVGPLVFPWISSVSIEEKDGIDTRVLVKSEKESWTQSENYMLAPDSIEAPKREELDTFQLIAEAKKKNGGKFLLIPCSRFAKEQYISPERGNLSFLLNIVNNYASQGALSGIRSRAVAMSPLKELPENTKDAIKYINMLALPGLFALIGMFRLVRRR